MTVAQTILHQLGGRRFIVMTGAKHFVGSDNALTFRVPISKNEINAVQIELTVMDTYIMRFFTMRGTDKSLVAEYTDVYNDQLQELFTHQTGLHTRL